MSYYPNGAIQQFTYGNLITHTLSQNDRQLPEASCDFYGVSCTGAVAAAAVLNDVYDYDTHGNVQSISDGRTGNRGNRDMAYDGLDRLTSTTSPMFTGGTLYSYNALDNLTRMKAPGRDTYYCYNAKNQLEFLRTGPVCTGTGTPTPTTLHYDDQGNLADKNNADYTFDYGNRLRSVTGTPASSYVYDGHGRRVQDVAALTKYSQYTHTGQLAITGDGQTVSEYVYLGGSLVAIRERDVPTNVYTTKYQHTDALGSPVAVTIADRTVLEKSEYEPYGKLLNRPAKNGPGFTGHVLDAATGMNYMQQRYYDPQIGRFLSVDPVTADGNTGSNFNRYWYANNNPYKFTDPDGRIVVFALNNGATFSDQATTMAYLFSSSTASGEILQLMHSEETYTIAFDRSEAAREMNYDAATRTVTVNPTSGLVIESSGEVQSPALGGFHEIAHAAEHDRIGTEAFEKNLESPILGVKEMEYEGLKGLSTTDGTSVEEARATIMEGQVARELGESTRQDYRDIDEKVETCGPTTTIQC